METTLYSLLGVPADADTAAIALAYARLLHRPDPSGARATLTYAFLVLSDPRRRAAYDAALHKHPPDAAAEETAPASPRPPTIENTPAQ